MKGIVILLFVLRCSLVGTAQPKSDSLFNTKLYFIENGRFLLIGSEKPGSFRKTIIRLYDENLKLVKQINSKNIRNSDVYLDKNLLNSFRIIFKYRWNKGKVNLFNKDMEVISSKFFKRDAYKEWKKGNDLPAGFVDLSKDRLYGFDPIFYDDSLCYFYNKSLGKIEICKADFSNIKPVFLPITSYTIPLNSEIDQYRFKKMKDGKICFFYSMNLKGKHTNYFSIVGSANGGGDLETYQLENPTNKVFFISDFILNTNLLVTSGSYCYDSLYKNGSLEQRKEQSMNGFFMNAYEVKNNKIKSTASFIDTNYLKGQKEISGFKTHRLEWNKSYISCVFEKCVLRKKTAKTENINGDYWVYESPSFVNFKYYLEEKGVFQEEFQLNYNPKNEDFLKDKQWKTFQNKHGQSMRDLIFNGVLFSGFNDLAIKRVGANKVVYSDRNRNLFMATWTELNYLNQLVYLNVKNSDYYYFDDYYIKFTQTDWGYRLEKLTY